jgi:hypothetical protein
LGWGTRLGWTSRFLSSAVTANSTKVLISALSRALDRFVERLTEAMVLVRVACGEEMGRKNPYFSPLIGEKNLGVRVELLGEELGRKNPYFIPLIGEKNLGVWFEPLGR